MNVLESMPRPTKAYHKKPYPAISPFRPELNLSRKTVLITGGGTGIGFAITQAFAEAGVSTIALLSRRAEPLDKAKSEIEAKFPQTKVLPFTASISDAAAVTSITQALGTIDVLVLSAAYMGKAIPTLDTPQTDTLATFETNVFGPIYLTQAFKALPPRSPDAERTIIYVSSAGIQFPFPGTGIYNASKAAMTHLLNSTHAETQGQNLRIFSFHPAIGFTPLSEDVFGLKGDEGGYDDLALPGRYAVWLASAEADFLKGRYTWAHWDVEELKAKKEEILRDGMQLTLNVVMDKVVD